MSRLLTYLRRLFLIGIVVGGGYAASHVSAPRAALPARDGLALASVRSWGYQLQLAHPDRIGAAIDLLVIDSQRGSTPHETLRPETVERFKERPDGSKRIVLAYMSIGEAETYRYYWWPHWSVSAPSWLGRENATWKGNYVVRFWEAGWRRIIVHSKPTLLDRGFEMIATSRKPYIDRIIEAGFDGIYLDRVDAYYEWQKTRRTAEISMVDFVGEISEYAKARKPGFIVIAQNAEELLKHASYRKRIDGVAKEDLLFGVGHTDAENKPADVTASIALLDRARADKMPVFLVEYLSDPAKRARAEARARSLGYLPLFADRALDKPPELMTPQPLATPRDTLPQHPARPKG